MPLYPAALGVYALSTVFAAVAFARRAEGLSRVAAGVLLGGLAVHAAALVPRLRAGGLDTPHSITSAYVLVSLTLAYAVSLRYRFRTSLLALILVPMAIAAASLAIDPAFRPFGDRLAGWGTQLHLGGLVAAYACFSVGATLGGLLVLRARSLKAKRGGWAADSLPPQRDLDRATVLVTELGLAALSLSMAVAAVVMKGGSVAIQGRKLGLAIATWAIYASLVAGRRVRRWRGERVGWGALAALLLAFASFVGIVYYARGTP